MNQESLSKQVGPPLPVSQARHIGLLMELVFLSAPYFFLRLYGTDYQQGSSLSLVDIFLFCAGINLLFIALKVVRGRYIRLRYVSVPLLVVGGLFVVVSLLSGLEGSIIYGISISLETLLSGTVQYAFIMIFLPLLASYYVTIDKLKSTMRFIGLGYLFPMILTIILTPESSPESMREAFFFAGRALGTYGNAVSFAAVLMIVLPHYALLFVTEKGFWRAIGLTGVNLTMICLALTISFSGMLIFLCLLAGNILLAFVWRDHPLHTFKLKFINLAIFTTLFLSITAGIAIAFSPALQEVMMHRLFFLDQSSETPLELENLGSADQRLYLIDVALKLINDRDGGLLSGHGMRHTASIPAFSFYGPHQEVHLIYLLLWIEGGLILLVLYLVFLFFLIRNVMKLARISPTGAVAVGSAVVALTLFGMLNPHLYLRYFWIPILPAFVNWDGYLRHEADAS